MYADVILPLPLHDQFTYAVPASMRAAIMKGMRVVVPFGRRNHYTAIVTRLHREAPVNIETKEIHALIDREAVVNEQQLLLWAWISAYYLSPPGEVYKAALPAPMKSEDLQRRYTPKTATFYRISPGVERASIPSLVGRAKKQHSLIDEVTHYLEENNVEEVSRRVISSFECYSPSLLNGLMKKGILTTVSREVSRLESDRQPTREPYPLNRHQQEAFDAVNHYLQEGKNALLFGVTSSGKTEIYIHLIAEQLAQGKQTLYLLPEIALTAQLTGRLQAVWGNRIGIYHSRIKDNERTEIWQKMLSDKPYEIILGVRSSLFLPFRHLGLVIVDEEHEASYKQQEPAPRYHARDTAVMLAHLHGVPTLLGSATPSLESFYNAITGKYGMVRLNERFNGVMMPRIQLENTRELRRRKKMKSLLTPLLIEEISKALDQGEQVILFRNRRGFAPLVECRNCAWTPRCSRCDVALTYHKRSNRLVCHYCNSSYPLPSVCPSCHEKSLEPLGEGTEQLEEEVSYLFPQAVVARMDMDTTRGKDAYETIIHDFQEKSIDILVGTQMLSKGLHFANVRVVGIIAADSLLNYPDFRAHERGYQLMTQAAGRSGRSGRKDKQGIVIIQSADPAQPVYAHILRNDNEAFFNSQLRERKQFSYPPYCRLIRIVIKHKEEKKTEAAATMLAGLIRRKLHERVLGPNKPIVSRVQLYHIREILLKLERGCSIWQVRAILRSAEEELRSSPLYRYITLYYDVDPQ